MWERPTNTLYLLIDCDPGADSGSSKTAAECLEINARGMTSCPRPREMEKEAPERKISSEAEVLQAPLKGPGRLTGKLNTQKPPDSLLSRRVRASLTYVTAKLEKTPSVPPLFLDNLWLVQRLGFVV